jgi:hypothetical protein
MKPELYIRSTRTALAKENKKKFSPQEPHVELVFRGTGYSPTSKHLGAPSHPIVGRKILFNAVNRARIIEAVRAGNRKIVAARYAGVLPPTVDQWLQTGRHDIEAGKETEYSKFYTEFHTACNEFEMEQVQNIRQAAKDDWKAAKAILEVRHRNIYGDTKRHEITGEGGGPVLVFAATAERVNAMLVQSQEYVARKLNSGGVDGDGVYVAEPVGEAGADNP